MSKRNRAKSKRHASQPRIINRRARHEYHILDTIEMGVVLTGSEVKSVRQGRVSLAEGYVRATETPLEVELIGVHIAEYAPAAANQHMPTRARRLLAHKREILELARATSVKGVTIVPLEMCFRHGLIKVVIGLARGKSRVDKRQDQRAREAQRDIDRAMSKRV